MKNLFAFLLAFALSFLSQFALALPPDFTPITTAADFSTVITVILAVAAIMATVHVVMKGAKMALAALKGL